MATRKRPSKPESDPAREYDFRKDMMRSLLTEPLLSLSAKEPDRTFDVILTLNELHHAGLEGARKGLEGWLRERQITPGAVSGYVLAAMTGKQITDLAIYQRRLFDSEFGKAGPWIYRIWEDSEVSTCLTQSLVTIKADAAHRAFNALGRGIVWAVLDSGIDAKHPHFAPQVHPRFGTLDTLAPSAPLTHQDFTPGDAAPLEDQFGHGTHVAGIIAGAYQPPANQQDIGATEMRSDLDDKPATIRFRVAEISGVAPQCRLLSFKVISDRTDKSTSRVAGKGKVSWILNAINKIQELNEGGRRLRIHGANLSLGYGFDPRWFACGQSPLCVEVDRLVKSGVCVVVAAGNSGYSSWVTETGASQSGYVDLSINDPGNSELAVTVGATHRDMPHTYGVSYFSSKGPTGDGRLKPDLVAPGERIVSCAAGAERTKFESAAGSAPDSQPIYYCEQSGTSMAAPHVSGAIAAFLSVRGEFIGQPEKVKQILLANTIDLRRERYFQGAGLLDIMKVLQAI